MDYPATFPQQELHPQSRLVLPRTRGNWQLPLAENKYCRDQPSIRLLPLRQRAEQTLRSPYRLVECRLVELTLHRYPSQQEPIYRKLSQWQHSQLLEDSALMRESQDI